MSPILFGNFLQIYQYLLGASQIVSKEFQTHFQTFFKEIWAFPVSLKYRVSFYQGYNIEDTIVKMLNHQKFFSYPTRPLLEKKLRLVPQPFNWAIRPGNMC
jgi:hypothetical protein